jgi:hypothetical protein
MGKTRQGQENANHGRQGSARQKGKLGGGVGERTLPKRAHPGNLGNEIRLRWGDVSSRAEASMHSGANHHQLFGSLADATAALVASGTGVRGQSNFLSLLLLFLVGGSEGSHPPHQPASV